MKAEGNASPLRLSSGSEINPLKEELSDGLITMTVCRINTLPARRNAYVLKRILRWLSQICNCIIFAGLLVVIIHCQASLSLPKSRARLILSYFSFPYRRAEAVLWDLAHYKSHGVWRMAYSGRIRERISGRITASALKHHLELSFN